MKVATIQFAPAFKDKEGNLRRLANLILLASKRGARLIVMPELATTGYSLMSAEEAEPLAEVITGYLKSGGTRTMDVMGVLAKRTGAALVWGMVEKDYGTGRLYNSQVLMTPDNLFVAYRKVNRWGNDFLWAAKGDGNPPITEFGGKRVGLLVCRDVRDKDGKGEDRFYEKGDADIVVLSANWGDGGFPATNWVDFAEEHKATLVVSNRYGKEANNDFGEGGVCIIHPDGRVACGGLVWNQDCIVFDEV